MEIRSKADSVCENRRETGNDQKEECSIVRDGVKGGIDRFLMTGKCNPFEGV